MSLPSPALTVPTLSDWQLYYAGPALSGVTFGPAPFFWQPKPTGLDLPNIRNGDSNQPRSRGDYIGLDVDDIRDLTVTFDVGGSNLGGYASVQAALSALRAVTNTQGTTEYPLWIKLPNFPLSVMMCRVRKRNFPPDLAYSLGNLAQNCAIQFHAADPYFYAAPTLDPSVGLPTPGLGFGFNMTFNLNFGGASGGNTLSVFNTGDVPCYPLLTITGPCLNPSISNTSMPGNPTLTFDIQLSAGDQLLINTDFPQSVTYFADGSNTGSTRMNTLQPGYAWWALPPGQSIIAFNSQDITAVAGTLTVDWTSAFSSIV